MRLLLAVALLPAHAVACLNDRDTLGYELRNKPEVQAALTGRFERNPPVYYEARIKRIRAIEKPTADDVDDLAVALDRLGRPREGIAALEAARDLRATPESRYRHVANHGTMLAHAYLSEGRKDPALLARAEAEITLALQMKPDAHFGREKVQLEVLRWMRTLEKSDGSTLADPLRKLPGEDEEWARGLAGLVVLGAAWESPDVVDAIGVLSSRTGALHQLAAARFDELRKAGRVPLSSSLADAGMKPHRYHTAKTRVPDVPVPARFTVLRAEAEAERTRRDAYLTAEIGKGRHPDTDPEFWKGFNVRSQPMVPDPEGKGSPSVPVWAWAALPVVLGGGAWAAGQVGRAGRRRKRIIARRD